MIQSHHPFKAKSLAVFTKRTQKAEKVRNAMLRRIYKRMSSRRRGEFPLDRTDTRQIPPDYQGLVVTSDIDKTYLDTHFSSLRGLLRTAFESAEEKQAIGGMIPLLRALRYGLQEQDEKTPLYFVSASPPQMRDVLEQKMQLDGIEYDGIAFKNQLRLLRHRRWKQIRHHVLYKLTALLLNRDARPPEANVQEILIGDDSETDSDTYLLYAKLLEGNVSEEECLEKLEELGATDKEKERILPLMLQHDNSRVIRIYIHRTIGRLPSELPDHPKELMLAARDSLQIVIDAWLHGWVKRETIFEVAKDLDPYARLGSLKESQLRGLFDPEILEDLRMELLQKGLLPRKPQAPLETPIFSHRQETKQPRYDFQVRPSKLRKTHTLTQHIHAKHPKRKGPSQKSFHKKPRH